VIGEREMNILKNIAEENMLIETVTGKNGGAIFGETRILNGRRGSVLVSQYSAKKLSSTEP
jgi:hypothetical protein